MKWRGFCNAYGDSIQSQPTSAVSCANQETDTVLLSSPSENIERFMNETEWSYFNEWSVLSIAFLSGGLGPTRLWTCTIPQLALTEPTLRYGAMAIGALHKAAESQNATAFSAEGSSKHYDNAVVYYCEALKRQAVAGPSKDGLRTALLSSLLFICFEAQRGNTPSALQHMTHGFGMLNELACCTDRAPSLVSIAAAPPTFVQDILDCYKPLELQARSFLTSYQRLAFPKSLDQIATGPHGKRLNGNTMELRLLSRPPATPASLPRPPQLDQSRIVEPQTAPCHGDTTVDCTLSSPAKPARQTRLLPFDKHTPYFRPQLSSITSLENMPSGFKDLDETLGYFTLIHKYMVQHIPMLLAATSRLALTKVASEAELEMELFRIKRDERIQAFISESRYWLRRWDQAYLHLFQLSTSEPLYNSKDHLKAINLRVEYLIMYVYTTMTRFSSISTAHALTPQYMEINALCERLLSSQKNCGFAMDSGWTWPLFVSAIGCREAAVRADAIRILGQYPRRNALRDSRVFRAIALKNDEIETHVTSEGNEDQQWLRLRRREVIFEDLGTSVIYRSSQKNEQSGQWLLLEEVADFAVKADGRLKWRRVAISNSSSIMAGVC